MKLKTFVLLCVLALVTPVFGAPSSSRDFDGANDKIDVGSASELDNAGGDDFSGAVWTYCDNDNLDGKLICKRDSWSGGAWGFTGGDGSSFAGAYNVFRRTSSTLHLRRSNNSTLTTTKWHFAMFTHTGDSAGTSSKIYDGYYGSNVSEVSYQTTQGSGTVGTDAALVLTIGIQGDNGGDYDGRICYVQYFDRVVSNDWEQIEMMWKPGIIVQNLVGYWPLWGGNSPEQDLSQYSNTGTVTGATSHSDGPPVFFN